ncbi:MAG: hypothetical protein K5776_01930 [Lachnospiraceae bacterium]|nr:hypothetical protein [Lachnospiraceae bacterium]
MALVKARCTFCGVTLDVEENKDAEVCKHCGTPFVVEKAIRNYIQGFSSGNNEPFEYYKEDGMKKSVEKKSDEGRKSEKIKYLYEKIDKELRLNNYKEVSQLCSELLCIDETEFLAWKIKGNALFFDNIFDNSDSAIDCYEKCLKYSGNENELYKKEIVKDIIDQVMEEVSNLSGPIMFSLLHAECFILKDIMVILDSKIIPFFDKINATIEEDFMTVPAKYVFLMSFYSECFEDTTNIFKCIHENERKFTRVDDEDLEYHLETIDFAIMLSERVFMLLPKYTNISAESLCIAHGTEEEMNKVKKACATMLEYFYGIKYKLLSNLPSRMRPDLNSISNEIAYWEKEKMKYEDFSIGGLIRNLFF